MKTYIVFIIIGLIILGLLFAINFVIADCSTITEDTTVNLNVEEGYSPYVQLCYGISFT